MHTARRMGAPSISKALAGLLAAAAALAGAAGAAAPGVALPNCIGQPQVRPASVTLTCADANFTAQGLRWTGWGQSFAAARGFAQVNDCTPTCVAGKVHRYQIVLLASGTQKCGSGGRAYAKVTYAFIGSGPSSVDPDPTVPFRCR